VPDELSKVIFCDADVILFPLPTITESLTPEFIMLSLPLNKTFESKIFPFCGVESLNEGLTSEPIESPLPPLIFF
jgi:hypothetical protein